MRHNRGMETWKDITGYDFHYQVSNLGRVRTFSRWPEGRIMKPFLPPGGRLAVKLIKDNRPVSKLIHQLVLAAFVGPCPLGHVCCHGPGGAYDNRLVNLTYATHSTNCFDKYRDGTMYNATRVRRSDGKVFRSLSEAARQTPGAHYANILRVLRGERYTAGGFTWEVASA